MRLYKFIILLLLCMLSGFSYAQSPVHWTGTTSNDWGTAANWSSNKVPTGIDNVQIGVMAFTNQPVVNSNSQVSSITFGSIQPVVFTVVQNATLQVTGNIIQTHSADNAAPLTLLAGNGNLTCNAFFVGNTLVTKVIASKTTGVISTIANLVINTNLTLYTTSSDLLSGGRGNNNSSFSLQAGRANIAGQIKTYHQIPTYLQTIANKSYARFSIDIVGSQNPTLVLSDSVSVSITDSNTDTINFNHHITGTGYSTVNYAGNNQLIYTNSFSALNNAFYTYQNLVISGSGVKTIVGPFGNTLLASGFINVEGGSLVTQETSSSIQVQAQQ